MMYNIFKIFPNGREAIVGREDDDESASKKMNRLHAEFPLHDFYARPDRPHPQGELIGKAVYELYLRHMDEIIRKGAHITENYKCVEFFVRFLQSMDAEELMEGCCRIIGEMDKGEELPFA